MTSSNESTSERFALAVVVDAADAEAAYDFVSDELAKPHPWEGPSSAVYVSEAVGVELGDVEEYDLADVVGVLDADVTRRNGEARLLAQARDWLRAKGEAEQVRMASAAEVVEMLEGSYPGGSAKFRADALAGKLTPAGEPAYTVVGRYGNRQTWIEAPGAQVFHDRAGEARSSRPSR